MPYCTVSGVRELIPFVTSGVQSDSVVSGMMARASGDVDAALRPLFQVPFTGTPGSGIDKVVEGIAEALTAAYCLSAYTGQHLGNRTEKIDELRDWADKRLSMILDRPEMLSAANHPLISAYGEQSHNSVMYYLEGNERVIDITKASTEWRFPSRSESKV